MLAVDFKNYRLRRKRAINIKSCETPLHIFFFFSVVRALVQDSKFLGFLRLKDCGCIYVIKDVLTLFFKELCVQLQGFRVQCILVCWKYWVQSVPVMHNLSLLFFFLLFLFETFLLCHVVYIYIFFLCTHKVAMHLMFS